MLYSRDIHRVIAFQPRFLRAVLRDDGERPKIQRPNLYRDYNPLIAMTPQPSGRLSEPAKSSIPSLRGQITSSLFMAVALTFLGAVVQRVLWEQGIYGIAGYLDDLLVGLVAGLLVFSYERSRSKDLEQKLEMISDMNHHIRNALQAIACVAYAEEAKQVQVIQHSVSRIEWALQTILPGPEERPHTRFWDTDPTDVMCPVCLAEKDAPCTNSTEFHQERIDAAELAAKKPHAS